jgi:cation diffusion facilitator family transporter
MSSYHIHTTASPEELRAMNLSLAASACMLVLKWTAFVITGSSAAFSDAAETIVHIAAVAFSSYSLRVAYRPPDKRHHYGHDKITYLASGMEGALVLCAGVVIIGESVLKWINGIELDHIGEGTSLIAAAAAVNIALGLYLIRTGKRKSSPILVANGTHVLSDAWTSGGVIVGLSLAWWTGWVYFDPIFAIAFAIKIMVDGAHIIREAVGGLMDATNPALEQAAHQALEEFCANENVEMSFHRVRLRQSGAKVYVDFHLQFPDGTTIEAAHAIATHAENSLAKALGQPADIMSHLESRHSSDHE